MGDRLSFWHDLTPSASEADLLWRVITHTIESAGRQDILQNPTVLDLGGGMGEFSKYLKSQGIRSVSLDIQDLAVPPEANAVRANAYQMPFADASFDIVNAHGIFDTGLYPHDYPKLLEEISRVLKQRGLLTFANYFSAPDKELKKFFNGLIEPSGYASTQMLWEKK